MREPKHKLCVLQCTSIYYYICNPIPLDNPKNHTALMYITWGLIWDLKNKVDREIPINKFHQAVTQDFKKKKKNNKRKEKREVSMQTSCKERRKILVVKFIKGTASKIAKVNHQIQASGMSCNLREVNLSHLGWIKKGSWKTQQIGIRKL